MKTLMETLDKFLCKRLLIVLMMPTEIFRKPDDMDINDYIVEVLIKDTRECKT